MDYLVTFEDGSTGYLAHHGVMGMKWGVRNAETQAKYAGKSGSATRRGGLSADTKRRLKTAAIGLGTAAAIGGAVYLGRRTGLAKIAATRAAKERAAKHILAQQRKSTASKAKQIQERFTNDWTRRNAKYGASRKSAKHHLKDSMREIRKPPHERNLRIENHPATKPAKQIADLLDSYQFDKFNHQITMNTYKHDYEVRRRVANALTAVGGAAAVGAGVGAGRSYSKRQKTNRV